MGNDGQGAFHEEAGRSVRIAGWKKGQTPKWGVSVLFKSSLATVRDCCPLINGPGAMDE